MCNSIFGKGQQVVGAGQDGVRRGLTAEMYLIICMKFALKFLKTLQISKKMIEKFGLIYLNYK
jgi:hypothetical protein